MARRDRTKEQLDALRDLPELDPEEARALLTRCLADSSNLVVSRAAELAGEQALRELEPALIDAYQRLAADPFELDPG